MEEPKLKKLEEFLFMFDTNHDGSVHLRLSPHLAPACTATSMQASCLLTSPSLSPHSHIQVISRTR